MTPDLIVTWSGAKERAGTTTYSLTSHLIGSTALQCMRLGGHEKADGPRLQDKPLPKRRCLRCLTLFAPPVELRNLRNVRHCADCTARDWSGTK